MKWQLVTAVLALSKADTWEDAILEWDWYDIWEESDGTCACGKFPIREHCGIYNKVTDKTLTVGNHCVNHFMGLRTDRFFKALNRVRKDLTKSLPIELLEKAWQQNAIDQRSFSFYDDIKRKQKLSEKQLAWKKDINRKVLKTYDSNR